ncbi:sensor histidine kinase [Spongiimicrobium salis]|uniref:sensor histidine kinase n=1 Tax=Spongiimicrobium salis TaxID=1667022 RepID=UPI00374DEBD0
MTHPLLERQIRKFLSEELASAEELQSFLQAVGASYQNNDDKLALIQRSTVISSEELSQANLELRNEVENQKKIFSALSNAIKMIDTSDTADEENPLADFDALKLAAKIEQQADKLVQLTSEKNTLLEDLEVQNESLSNYAHMVSHDLKSPIRNISALVSWIGEDEKEGLSEDSKRNFDLIARNLTKMDNLIDGILMHATIASYEGEKTNVDVTGLIEDIRETIFVPDHIKIKTTEGLPTIHTEKYKLEQLFKNLLTNAITAMEDSTDGAIVISVKDNKKFWEFSVKDNGKGIPKNYQASIFDMFKKLENNENATGIGLALVKKIVNSYKGEIWLNSDVGEGTTFFFTIKKQVA